jgi:hypothetical protein
MLYRRFFAVSELKQPMWMANRAAVSVAVSPALLLSSAKPVSSQQQVGVTSCKGRRTRAVKIAWHTTEGAIWGFYHCMLGSIVPLMALLAPPSQFHPCDVIIMCSGTNAVCTDHFDHNNFSSLLAARFPGGDSPGPAVVVFHGRGFKGNAPVPGLLEAAERAGLATGNSSTVWETRNSRGFDGLLNTCYSDFAVLGKIVNPVSPWPITLNTAMSEALQKAARLMRDVCGCSRPRTSASPRSGGGRKEDSEAFTILVEQRVRAGENGAQREAHIVNHDAVVDALTAAFPAPSFRVRSVQLAKMSLCEQVCLASSSSVLVGIHGAALVHLMFLQPRALVEDGSKTAGVVEIQGCHYNPLKTM